MGKQKVEDRCVRVRPSSSSSSSFSGLGQQETCHTHAKKGEKRASQSKNKKATRKRNKVQSERGPLTRYNTIPLLIAKRERKVYETHFCSISIPIFQQGWLLSQWVSE